MKKICKTTCSNMHNMLVYKIKNTFKNMQLKFWKIKNVRNVQKLCKPENMHYLHEWRHSEKISKKYAKNFQKICQKYVIHMQKLQQYALLMSLTNSQAEPLCTQAGRPLPANMVFNSVLVQYIAAAPTLCQCLHAFGNSWWRMVSLWLVMTRRFIGARNY